MKLSLVVITPGKSEGKAIPITLAQFLIGRDAHCNLRPASASISKRHCAILVKGGKVFVRDFDSTNGTFVNDQQVKGEVELHPDDRLKIGPLLFRVQMETKSPAAKETPPPATRATPPPPTKAPVPAEAARSKPAKPAASAPQRPPSQPVDDEAAAAWLLSLQEDGTPSTSEGVEVPEGSTVVMTPEQMAENAEKKESEAAGQAGAKKPEPGKAAAQMADTANKARDILQKYMRRPRS